MASFQGPSAVLDPEIKAPTAPLVVLFERDDAIAVPLLSQLRMAGYDVRSSRTPVELFDILSKHLVSLVLVDLGNATAGRREFWVALDAQRRGRAIQVMTFRYIEPTSFYDTDFEPAGRALADVEVHGAHEFQALIEGVRQRIPLTGGMVGASPQSFPSMPGMQGMPGAFGGASPQSYPGGIAPIGAALGVPSPFMQSMPNAAAPYGVPAYDPAAMGGAPGFDPQHQYGQQYGQPGQYGGYSARPMPPVYPYPQSPIPANPYTPPPNPYVHPAQPNFAVNPFGGEAPASQFANPVAGNPFAQEIEDSPFAQPLNANPFASDMPGDAGAMPSDPPNPFSPPQWAQPGAPLHGNPFSPPAPASDPAWQASMPGNSFAGPFADSGQPSSFGAFSPPFGLSHPEQIGSQSEPGRRAKPPISDVWTPPDSDGEYFQQTSVVPEVGAQSTLDRWGTEEPVSHAASEPTTQEHPWYARPPSAGSFTEHQTQQNTAPIPAPPPLANLPAVRQSETERALGNVLVEGALLTEQRFEALKGIQQMLASVDMEFKLGELALLFKFLSPDQLLAALLVSRGLVSPQQIAGLGRVKQELSASGMDYDLETLLVMFHIMPNEQLRRIRAELA